jgi:hypothetical protein
MKTGHLIVAAALAIAGDFTRASGRVDVLADADFPRRPALRPARGALRLRRPNQRRMCFRAYVEQQLVPLLKPGDIAGARLWYLPPYSPDLNPIEQAFAKIKHWMPSAQKPNHRRWAPCQRPLRP